MMLSGFLSTFSFFFFTADEGSSTNAILLIAGKIIVNIFCG